LPGEVLTVRLRLLLLVAVAALVSLPQLSCKGLRENPVSSQPSDGGVDQGPACAGKMCNGTCIPGATCCTVAECTMPAGGTVACTANQCVQTCTNTSLTACSNTCTDTTSDIHNCGRCGRDCMGGGCSQSACGIVTLAPADVGNDLALETSAQSVFLSKFPYRADQITALPKNGLDLGDGGILPEFQSAFQMVITSIAVDASNVYWVFNRTQIMKIPYQDGSPYAMPSGSASMLFDASTMNAPDGGGPLEIDARPTDPFTDGSDLRLAGTRLCAITSAGDGSDASLISMDLDGTNVKTLQAGTVMGAFTTNGNNAFYASTGTVIPEIDQIDARGSSNKIVLMTNYGTPNAMASNGELLWFAYATTINRVRVGVSMQGNDTFYNAPTGNYIIAVLADADYAYWIENVSAITSYPPQCMGTIIYRKAKNAATSAAPEQLGMVPGPGGGNYGSCATGAAAIDSTAIYWIFGMTYSGQLMKIAK
jgi:hypothetical protein